GLTGTATRNTSSSRSAPRSPEFLDEPKKSQEGKLTPIPFGLKSPSRVIFWANRGDFSPSFFLPHSQRKKKPATGGQLKQECDVICRHLGHWGMDVYAYRIKLNEIRCMPENHFQIVLCSIYVGLEFSTVIRSIFDWVLVSSNAACGGGL
ncbi:hypothetical protein ABXT34_23650, partial [Ralstonia sp. SM1884_UCD616_TZ26]|uniref:hypothetical protein n=1 Tax=Ralstonia pseudosolanacearum TaxID=1310165 RepID=UPI0033930CBF